MSVQQNVEAYWSVQLNKVDEINVRQDYAMALRSSDNYDIINGNSYVFCDDAGLLSKTD